MDKLNEIDGKLIEILVNGSKELLDEPELKAHNLRAASDMLKKPLHV